MNEYQASRIAEVLGGEPWQSGGDIWLVMNYRQDGKLVVISDDVICLYDNQECFDSAEPTTSILLR